MKDTRIDLADGTFVAVPLSACNLVPKSPPRFELVMCERDHRGNKLEKKSRVYAGNHPPAVEATFLRSLSDTEKTRDVYAEDES